MPETTMPYRDNQTRVPVGLSTRVGLIAAAIGALMAPLVTVAEGDQTETSIGALAFAALNLYAVIRGRMDQAAAREMPR